MRRLIAALPLAALLVSGCSGHEDVSTPKPLPASLCHGTTTGAAWQALVPKAHYHVKQHATPGPALLTENRPVICSINSFYDGWYVDFVLLTFPGERGPLSPEYGSPIAPGAIGNADDLQASVRWPQACTAPDGSKVTVTAKLVASTSPAIGTDTTTRSASPGGGRPGNRPLLVAELLKLSNAWMDKLHCGDQRFPVPPVLPSP
jgi:hypothetical protein